ncbi:MAG: Gfo/Idh/MocA family oxidoreductase [Clostridia bacterium]|nr:Gfo/Idh/MocA family oxidoreductase [Clostridia bacterium]
MSKKDTQSILDEFKNAPTEEKVQTGRKLKVGIIGTGWIADAHAQKYKMMEDVEVVALADLVPGKAEKFAEKWEFTDAKCYLSHKDLLDAETDIDAVSICTYNRTHAECSIYALKKGVHVLCEKPMCVTLEEAVEMRKAEKESGKLLSIGFQPRMNPNMKKVKEIVESGVLGEIYYIQTGGGRRRGIPTPFGTTFIEDKTAGIGAMGDIGCYSLDMVLNAIGYPKPLTVTGYTSNFFGIDPKNYPWHPEYAEKFEVEDFAAGFIRLEGGIILDFRIAWAMNLDTPGDTIIMGKKGSLRIPSTECWNGSVGGPMKIYSEMAGSQVCTEIPLLPDGDCFYHKIRSFLDAILTNGKSPVPSEQIIINQAIIDGIVNSAKLGKELEINIPEV